MHELAIINDLITEAEKRGNVKGVVVEVGDLAALEAEEIKEMLSTKGWDIRIESKKSAVKCQCGFSGEPEISARVRDIIFFNCPQCGKIPEITYGDKIVLKEVLL